LTDEGVIRSSLKVNAAIENAKTILVLRKKFGSFEKWLEPNHPKTKEEKSG
jgi:DNA-3-methyladenine glycosylase I